MCLIDKYHHGINPHANHKARKVNAHRAWMKICTFTLCSAAFMFCWPEVKYMEGGVSYGDLSFLAWVSGIQLSHHVFQQSHWISEICSKKPHSSESELRFAPGMNCRCSLNQRQMKEEITEWANWLKLVLQAKKKMLSHLGTEG